MAPSLTELRSLSDEEIIRRHDDAARGTQTSVNYYLTELARRDQDTQTKAMLSYTKEIRSLTGQIRFLTWIMAFLTVGSVITNVIVVAGPAISTFLMRVGLP